jgi:hypothetical protein
MGSLVAAMIPLAGCRERAARQHLPSRIRPLADPVPAWCCRSTSPLSQMFKADSSDAVNARLLNTCPAALNVALSSWPVACKKERETWVSLQCYMNDLVHYGPPEVSSRGRYEGGLNG